MSAGSGWRLASASVRGVAHLAAQTPCQDHHATAILEQANGQRVLIGAVADGAGTAALSHQGAAAFTAGFRDAASAYLQHQPVESADENVVRSWFDAARQSVLRTAQELAVSPTQFACTFLGAVVGEAAALFVQVGDGVMVFRDASSNPWQLVSRPQRGEYLNETYFVTDNDVYERVAIRRFEQSIAEFAMSTDGLEQLYWERAADAVFAPFFDSLFKTMVETDAGAAAIDAALDSYLQSQPVNAHTNDDKTLVLAIRRSGPEL